MKKILPLTIEDPQAGWKEAFNRLADSENEELLEDVPTDFEKDEWA